MLQSGASAVYLVQATEKELPAMYTHLQELLPKNIPVVCESGSFALVYQPGLHLLVKGSQENLKKPTYFANLIRANVHLDQHEVFGHQIKFNVNYQNGLWTFKKVINDSARKSA
jgi:hypothetical protein